MLYLNENHIKDLDLSWKDTIGVIGEALQLYSNDDFIQPIKPYIKFKNSPNRVIAMPAYAGGNTSTIGIKWIASFPRNTEFNISRAHSITILNDPFNGKPFSIINTSLISAIRTVSVSGFIITNYLQAIKGAKYTVGIIGMGPIGRLHTEMVNYLLNDRLEKILIYDLSTLSIDLLPERIKSKCVICNGWEEAYSEADIFITCTVSTEGYIDKAPKLGSLHLNVSLRDYKPEIVKYMNVIIVDNWEEVCRENTDIEKMYTEGQLKKSDVYFLNEIESLFPTIYSTRRATVMVNPMGMALFDIAIAKYCYDCALEKEIGIFLED